MKNEMKFIGMLTALLFVSVTVQAATLAHESFLGYADGQWTTSMNGGLGWGGAWGGDADDFAMYVKTSQTPDDSLVYTGLTTSNGWGQCRADNSYDGDVDGTGANTIRTRDLDTGAAGAFAGYLDSGLIGASGKTLWMGCVIHGEDTASNMHMQWRNGTTSVLELQATFDNTDAMTLGSTNSSTTITQDVNHFVLLKFEFGAGDATVSFWLDPVIASGEGGLGTADAVETGIADFDNFYFEAGTDTDDVEGGRVRVDEIRFAEEFAGTYQNTLPAPPASGTIIMFR